MDTTPKIRYVDIYQFDDETIRWMFGKNGKRMGFAQTIWVTLDEAEKIWPGIKRDHS